MPTLNHRLQKYPHGVFASAFITLSLSYSLIHCLLYLDVIAGVPISLAEAIIWSLKKFGFWWLAYAALLPLMSRLWIQKSVLFTVATCGLLIAATIAALLLHYLHIGGNEALPASLLTLLPSQLVSAGGLLFGSILCSRSQQNPAEIIDSSLDSKLEPKKFSLTVYQGNNELELPVNQIESISAEGNYMEVFDGARAYLLRATMKTLEEQLQPYDFFRVHRSHLVNAAKVRFSRNKQEIVLSDERRLPIGQKFRRNINKIQGLN